jgi:transposase-like protein
MPKSPDFNESQMSKAFTTAITEKKPNIAKIARQFNVSPTTLRSRLKKAKTLVTPTPSKKNALQPYQETALTN